MRQPNHYRGSRLPQAKLTEDDVRDIREEVNRLRDPGGWMPRRVGKCKRVVGRVIGSSAILMQMRMIAQMVAMGSVRSML